MDTFPRPLRRRYRGFCGWNGDESLPSPLSSPRRACANVRTPRWPLLLAQRRDRGPREAWLFASARLALERNLRHSHHPVRSPACAFRSTLLGRVAVAVAPEVASRSRGGPPCQSRHSAVASSRGWPPLAWRTAWVRCCTASRGMHAVPPSGWPRCSCRGVALQHAVGEEHQPVADLQWQRCPGSRLRPADRTGGRPPTNLFDLPGPHPERRGMAGVGECRRRCG